jgi:hypothetical protein
MADEIPDEVYEAAARAYYYEAYGAEVSRPSPSIRACADAVYPLAFTAGRHSIHTEWATSLADDARPDDPEEMWARLRRDARALVEQGIRIETAANIRNATSDTGSSGHFMVILRLLSDRGEASWTG